MNDGCTNKRFEEMLHHYELGMLSDEDRRELEIHLMECEHCHQEAQSLKHAARLMKTDPDVRAIVREVADRQSEKAIDFEPKAPDEGVGISPSIKTILAVAAVLVILLLRPWDLTFVPSSDIIAAGNRVLVMRFDNMSQPEDTARLGEIVANLLTTDLSESHYMQVVSTQRVSDILRLMGEEESQVPDDSLATEVARKAGVRWMLTGSILQTEPYQVVSYQLTDIDQGTVVAAHQVTGTEDEDLFGVIDRLTVVIKEDMSLPEGALQELDPGVADVTTSSPEAYRAYLAGMDDYSKYFYREAREDFHRAVELDSTFAMAYYWLARLENRDYLKKAVEYGAEASRKEQYYIRSLEASAAGDRKRAIVELSALVEDYPDEKRAYYLIGVYKSRTFRLEEAVAYLRKAIEIDPLYKNAYNQLAVTYDELGDYENAILALNEYISLAPDEPNPYDTRGQLQSSHGRLDEAIASFKKALEIKPDFVSSKRNLAYAYMYKREYGKAGEIFEQLASSGTEAARSSARFFGSLIPIAQGRFNEALDIVERGISIDVENGNASAESLKRFLKCRIFLEQGRMTEASEEFERHYQAYQRGQKANIPGSRQYFAQMLAELGEYDRAVEMAEQLKVDFESTDWGLSAHWYALGAIEMAKGNFDLAVPLFEGATKATIDFPVHFMLGRAYLEADRRSDAVKKFEEQLETYTIWRICWSIWDIKIHYYLGMAYEQSQWREEAIEQYEIFLGLWEDADPDIPALADARERLARLKAGS